MSDGTLGVYLHVPFCERVCPYCDFAVVAARTLPPAREDAYVDALLAELALRREAYGGLELETVYLGGGTPALLRAESVARLLRGVCAAFEGSPREVTLEVNPSTVERARLPGFREAGVDRLSIGVQSFDDAVLKRLGRAHRAEEADATWAAARAAGFENLSLDLILGVPEQTVADFEGDLARACALAPEHVSTYELTVEAGTPYARGVERGSLALPEEDDVLRMLDRADARLAEAGLPAYELSSHARPGCEAVHNARYWQRRPVLGLGVGAWSSEPATEATPHGGRRANPRDLAAYLEGVAAAALAPALQERFDAPTARGEAMFLGLRTRRGLEAAAFAAEFGDPPRTFFAGEIDYLREAGLLDEDGAGDLRLTPRGRRLADAVSAHFVADRD